MAEGDKPYRLYRGGRRKGKVPLGSQTRPSTQPTRTPDEPRRRRRWGLWVGLTLVLEGRRQGQRAPPSSRSCAPCKAGRVDPLRADDDPRRRNRRRPGPRAGRCKSIRLATPPPHPPPEAPHLLSL